MTDETTPTSDPTNPNTEGKSCSRDGNQARCGHRGHHPRRSWFRRFFFLGTVGLVGFFAVKGAMAGAGMGGGWACHRGGPESAAELREHMDFMSDRALDLVGASAAQRDGIASILDEAAPQAWGFREEGQALRERFRAALTADPVDEAALDQVRKEGLLLADRASAQALDDVVEASKTLTPEQRVRLAAWAEKFHDRGGKGRH